VIRDGLVDEAGFRTPPPLTIVTGASGWLGRSLVPILAQRSTAIRCLARTDSEAAEVALAGRSVVCLTGDVRSPADLDRLFDDGAGSTVIHAGSVIHPAKETREFFDVNVGGTALMLDRARRAGVQRFVYVSSNSPFGSSRDPGTIFDEDSAYHPESAYGASKMEAEQLVLRAHTDGDVETVIVRCPWFYGPHQPARQTRFMTLVRRGRFPLVGDGTNRRSLAYTVSLAEGLVRAELCERAAGRAYWVADREPYTMLAILAGVKRAFEAEGLPTSPRRPRLPSFIADVAGITDRALQRIGRYSQEIHVLSEMNRTIACTTARAEAELGYQPQVDLVEGMRASIRWSVERGDQI